MRVIGGRFGGRALAAPRGDRTRPTTDRVREALFSILGDLRGAVVADLYAGSGALGIEALSRGAERVVFVESARAALQSIEKNLAALHVDRTTATLIPVPVRRAGPALVAQGPYDVVFCDPPWAELSAAVDALESLLRLDLLSPAGALVLEHPASAASPEQLADQLVRASVRRWGDTAVSLFSRPEAAPNEGPTPEPMPPPSSPGARPAKSRSP